ncbi:4'-phosphopantetheinyl transferase [Gordonia jinhuaensis]|uniref:4'-phosphopantetheinyl transferase n=1 Tax=Gordonia jinhuaensis TaxID=1517702 RepID=A0A916T1X5_9ACTN|nr:4'-phosphopantetheinyl transferase [Gordonia jinhuaensis]GGB26521.1 4'-phosphopantetheinyl transferase [Gordonia jinhuaensis]
MIDQLLAPGIASAESFGDPDGLAPLPAEESLIARAVPKRRNEFVTTRHCARQALGSLGIDPVPILRGDKGQPLWPTSVVGSLTHCDGYRAAVAAYALQVRSLGIDAEPHERLPDGVLDHVSLPTERDDLAARTRDGSDSVQNDASEADPPVHWDRLLFCAKEATYKAWFPLTGRWLGFEDAHITFERTGPGGGTFHSQLLVDGSTHDGGTPLTEFSGRWLVQRDLILTAITV